ncbi:MAG: uncharacterized protein QOK35_2717 [Pseudonocardiales bacterium]|nr:uncharacterized protein [Pseudonocardiales bacterium]
MTPRLPGLAAAALACAVLLGGCATGTTPELGRPAPPSITTRGVGTVRGTPDTLTVDLGVQTRAASAADALADNSTRTTGLLDVLRGRGVSAADLRTSRLSINPTYDQNGGITGYEVTNEVTATLRDIAGAGALVDAAAQATGDAARVERIAFAIDDDAEPRARARGDAVRQAVTQARQLAAAADVTLGPILSITEVTAGEPPLPAARDSAAKASAAVPIEPGTQDVSVTVEVVHAVGG